MGFSRGETFSGLMSSIPPLDAMLNFDADVKKRQRVVGVIKCPSRETASPCMNS